MKKFSLHMIFLSTLLFMADCSSNNLHKIKGPEEKIEAAFYSDSLNSFVYSVWFNQNPIIAKSALGFVINDVDYGRDIQNVELNSYGKINEGKLVVLKNKHIQNHYNYYNYQIHHPKGDYQLYVRVYADGIAFRYNFLGLFGNLTSENTSWQITMNLKTWFFERENDWKLKTYAGLWKNTTLDSLHIISSTGPVQGKPLLFEMPENKYMMITEAALADYSGLRFEATNETTLCANFTEGEKGFLIEKEQLSPWRVILFADNLNQLVNNQVIANLNHSPDTSLFNNLSWIQPGRSVWSWWSRKENYMSIENEKKYIDFASQLNYEYALLDEGWENWSDKWCKLREMCKYADSINVHLWVWKNSNEIQNQHKMNQFLDSIKDVGVVGVKVDFMNSEAKELVDFDIQLLKACARRQLMVILHGCQTSTGEYVTYPNELTREGVRGMELNIMNQPLPACHNAALPFTRFVTGPADYTPVSFSNPGKTTWAHQLATAIIFDSPLFCLAEDPEYIFQNKNLSSVIELLKELPVTWDETIVLPESKVGELIVFCRRKGQNWYLAFLNGGKESKELDPHLYFLDNGTYTVTQWMDNGHGKIKNSKLKLSQKELHHIYLEPFGGAVVVLKKTIY